jgi:putative transposase
VEQNPLRAGLVEKPEMYAWSSATAHVTGEDPRKFLDMSQWAAIMDPDEWRRLLARPPAKAELRALRRNTRRGWPLAGDSALAKIEKMLGRRVRPLASGRPALRNKKSRPTVENER